jgi:hypothetical protein
VVDPVEEEEDEGQVEGLTDAVEETDTRDDWVEEEDKESLGDPVW